MRIEGNRRVEPETVKSYLTFNIGDPYDEEQVDESLKALFATNLFSDVRIRRSRTVVTVTVVENPIINQVAFENNKEVDDDTLQSEVQLKVRSVYTRARVQADVQRILDVYQRQGLFAASVQPKIIKLNHNRVDLVYEISEGPSTKVRNINFIGNKAFDDGQLRSVVRTTETNFMSFLKPTNVYDPDRLNVDRELIRLFYLKNGYADVRVVSAIADLDREGRGFFITFTIEEGEQYQFGDIEIETSLDTVDPEALEQKLLTRSGRIYNATLIDRSIELLTLDVAQSGFAFARVRPRVDRDVVERKINIKFIVEQGPRVYIERININGNVRTRDYVIRREFRVAEGDAYNRLIVNNARRRLMGLGFFKDVKISQETGSAQDRIILNVNIVEQATGEFSVGGGYSTQEGVIADISLTERNLLGRGQFLRLKLSGSLERGQIDLSFTEPRFLDRNLAAGFDLFHKEVDFSSEASYESRKTGGKIRFGVPLTDRVGFSTYYSFVRDEVYNVDDADASLAIQQAEGTSNVSAVGYALTFDTRNLKSNPTQGVYLRFGQEFAGVGGDVDYLRTTGEARGYYPIAKGYTLVGRVQAGYISGFDDDVRLIDHFYKGGETIRGFDRAGIGPRDENGNALGGTAFYSGTVELRFPFPYLTDEFGISGAVFADGGSLFDAESVSGIVVSGDNEEIRASVGGSVLWASPLGPLRADLAYVLQSDEVDEEEVFRFGAATRF
ncbi:MAG: outer membrane protein assembly factor BamA [Pseudomonadota bacterium]